MLVFCFLVRLPDTADQSIINTRIIGEENEEKTVSFGITQFFQKQFEPIASNYVITPMMCSWSLYQKRGFLSYPANFSDCESNSYLLPVVQKLIFLGAVWYWYNMMACPALSLLNCLLSRLRCSIVLVILLGSCWKQNRYCLCFVIDRDSTINFSDSQ